MTQVDDSQSGNAASTDVVSDAQETGMSLGEKLRTAREQQSLSLEQVAEALHLDATIIISLEQEHFEMLGASVYVRGHLKTYAQLLGLSADEILSTYHEGDAEEPVTAPALRQPGSVPATVNPVVWVGGVLIVLLGGLLGGYLLLDNDNAVDTFVARDVIVTPAADERVGSAASADDAIDEIKLTTAVEIRRTIAEPEVRVERPGTQVEVDDRAAVASPTEPQLNRPVATMRLGLHFNQESWVEISDANRRLLFGLQHEGNRREITGEPPFNLLIGNARGVELTINDEPFAVPVSRMRGKVARFEITGKESD